MDRKVRRATASTKKCRSKLDLIIRRRPSMRQKPSQGACSFFAVEGSLSPNRGARLCWRIVAQRILCWFWYADDEFCSCGLRQNAKQPYNLALWRARPAYLGGCFRWWRTFRCFVGRGALDVAFESRFYFGKFRLPTARVHLPFCFSPLCPLFRKESMAAESFHDKSRSLFR